jgi:serine/threonine protein kinase/tetratricopeptide (TPR) repeat protein
MSDEEYIPDLSDSLQPLNDVEESHSESRAHSVSLSESQASGERKAAAAGEPKSAKSKSKKKKKKPDPLIGQMLNGAYRLERKVGEGGMGNVYEATQFPLERKVAIKILKPSETNPEGEHYFMREVKAINMLRHPNIINVVDFGKDGDDGALFLVMEFLPGRTLERVIKKEFPLDPQRVCQVAIQVLNALESAHEAGIVHCDLKPANIMLEQVAGQNDFIKVLDFGIAKVKESGMKVGPYTQQGNIVGTFDYMSPEQIMRKDLDGRSDLWSLGVILYEMLTRKRIFHDKEAVSIIGRVMQMPVQPPSSLAEGVPEVLDKIVMKAMERNLNERFESAGEMRSALQKAARWLEANPSGIAPGGGPTPGDAAPSGSRSGSLADSGLVRDRSGNLTSSHGFSRSDTSDSAISALYTRSGSFSERPGSGQFANLRQGTSVAAGTSVLDQTFSVEELKGSLLGEKRQVAVLAVKQRSRAAEGIDSAEIARRSRAEKALITQIVAHFGGEVDSFLGGAFTVLFGAKRARVGDNLRAIECALELQKKLRQMPHGADHLGIGVVYGEVSLSKADGAHAYGDAIDRAIVVSGASRQAIVLADQSIADATRAKVDFDAPLSIGGQNASEVLKISAAADADLGEHKELDELDLHVPRPQLFDQLSRLAVDVQKGHGTGVAILGEMGVGKSKFLAKFVEAQSQAQSQSGAWQAFLVSEDDQRRAQSLAGVRSWVRQIAQTYHSPAKLLKKACQSIGLTQHVEDVVALYLKDDAEPAELNLPWTSQQEFSHFSAALLHKMVRFALKKGPVLLALDDAPVDDPPMLEFLDALIARTRKLAVMVLVTRQVAASVRDHGLPGNFEILEMHGFTREESRQFVAQILGHTPPMAVVEQLHMRSSGNPVFLHELVRSIRRNRGQEGLMNAELLAEAGVPTSLHELLAERVDALDEELRDLLRLASVLGESFGEEWFFQITPSHLQPRENLAVLVDHNMLAARFDSAGRVSLAFHPRALRKIVYDRLPDQARVEIHTRVIEFLESAPDVAAVDPIDVPLMLAFHYRSVGGFEGAAYYLGEGGELLLDQYDYAGAIAHFEDALALLDQAKAGADSEVRVSVQTRLLVALRESGRIEDAQRVVDRLGDVDSLDPAARHALLYEIGMTAMESGGIDQSLAALQKLCDAAVESGELKTEVRALLALAQLYEKQNQLGRAAEVLMNVPQKVEQLGQLDLSDPEDRKLFWTAYNQLGTLFIRQKDFQKAQQFLNSALQRAQQISDHRGLARVLSNLGALCLSMRDVKRAQSYFDNACKAAQGVGDLLNQSRILTNQGITAMQANQLDESKAFFKRARGIAEEIGWYEGLAELSIHIKRLKKALG